MNQCERKKVTSQVFTTVWMLSKGRVYVKHALKGIIPRKPCSCPSGQDITFY